MKTRIWVTALGLSVGLWGAGLCGEHPEHPTSEKKDTSAHHEHPGSHEKEHPKEHPQKASAQKTFQNDFEKFVKEHVASESQKTGGVYTVHDDTANKDWKLQLVKVHKTKICMLDEGKNCFACADFKEVGGKNKLDLDFYADKSEDGKMSMSKVLIHKVNGKPRFTYDKENKMVPVK